MINLKEIETYQDWSSSTGWTDMEAAVHLTVLEFKTESSGSQDLSTGWTDGIGSSDGFKEANSKVLAAKSSTSNELTARRLKRQMNCVNGYVWWRATTSSTGWTDAWKKHSVGSYDVLLSATFSQRLFGRLGLFIPPPPTHLRLLDCVEVQRSAWHYKDYIQAIQVLNCSPIDLHMLCVCA
jgi:hypothetical protein